MDTTNVQESDAFENRITLLQTVFDSIPEGIIISNKAGKVILFNEVLKKRYWEEENISYEDWDETFKLYYPDGTTDLPLEEFPLSKAILGQSVENMEFCIVNTKTKKSFLVSSNASPVKEIDNSQVGSVMVITDITYQRNRLGINDERYRMLAQACTDVVWDLDLATNDIWWNDALRQMGYDQDKEKLNLDWWTEMVHPDDRHVSAELDKAVEDGKDFWSAEYRFKRADGSYSYIFDRGFVVRDDSGKVVRMVGVMRDISMEKKLAEESKNRQDDIETLTSMITNRENKMVALKLELESLQNKLKGVSGE